MNLDVPLDGLRDRTLGTLKNSPKSESPIKDDGSPVDTIALADDAIGLLEAARDTCRDFDSNYIGTDHLVIAFFDVDSTKSILEGAGLSRNQVRDETFSLIRYGPDDSKNRGPLDPLFGQGGRGL